MQITKGQFRNHGRNLNYLLKEFNATIMTYFIEHLRNVGLVIEQDICDVRKIPHRFHRLYKRTDFIVQKTIQIVNKDNNPV